jgi:hypothetical protein
MYVSVEQRLQWKETWFDINCTDVGFIQYSKISDISKTTSNKEKPTSNRPLN